MNFSPTAATRHPCTSCQRRKVKCDRLLPCTGCLTHGQECQQPVAQRAPRRARRTRDDTVHQRMRQLEMSLEEIRDTVVRNETNPVAAGTIVVDGSLPEDSAGKLILEDGKSRYVSGSSWENLTNEFRDLKILLENNEHEEEEEEDETPEINSELSFPNSLFSYTGSKNHVFPAYTDKLGLLWEIYARNVDRVMKIFHIPSMNNVVQQAISNSGDNAIEIDCLIAAIKFAAVTSLTDEECLLSFSAPRLSLLKTFRKEVQSMLDTCNFLGSHDLTTLQSYVIFLVCNRRHVQSRNMWISTGIALRLAQSLGLHRDGIVMKLPVLVTEIRRRLWWQIRMLDVASAEDCGFLPTHIYGDDTRIPLNINDEDIPAANMLTSPPERDEFTEMTFSLIRFEICQDLHGFQNENGKSSMGIFTGEQGQIDDRVRALDDCRLRIETRYFRHCSQSDPIQRHALQIGDIMLSKLSLIARYPLFQASRSSSYVSDNVKRSLFNMSCEIVESSHKLITSPETSPLSWLLQTYVHWHPVAFLLHYICTNPGASDLYRAWKVSNLAIEDPHGLSLAANRSIWTPLQSLFAKASMVITTSNNHAHQQESSFARFEDYGVSASFDNSLIYSDGYLPIPTPGLFELRPFTTIDDFMMEPVDIINNFDSWWGDEALSPYNERIGNDSSI